MSKTKSCSICKKRKSLDQFSKRTRAKDGLDARCKACWAIKRKVSPETAEAYAIRRKRYYDKLRAQALAALGNACVRCGFDDWRALQIDHINGGGSQEKKQIHVESLYRRVIAGTPGYQCLCANCNWIKRYENGEHGIRKKI